jgi:imidazolonepropionase-like amidohydrolase
MTRRATTFLIGPLAGFLAAPVLAQDLTWKAPPQEAPIAIINAAIHPVSGPSIDNGFIFFDQGVIRQIGPMSDEPAFIGTTRILDAAGLHVYPGLIGPITDMGLLEMQETRPSTDLSENNDPNGEVYASVAVNPDSWLFPVARSGGILLAGTWPRGGDVPGHASLLRLDGWTSDEMTVDRDMGLIINWPNMRPFRSRFVQASDEEQAANTRRAVERIDGYFAQAEAYRDARLRDESLPIDLRYEGMLACLPRPHADRRAQEPVLINASDLDQITAAVTWAIGRGLRPIIAGGRDAPLCAELLRQNDVPVIIGGVFRFPKRADSPYDEAYSLPARCEEAGIRWCLATGGESMNERNLGQAAGMAVAYGLDMDAALRGITLSTAEILGVADQYGSLEADKSATLIVTTGTPLELTSTVVMAFIDGRAIDLSNKQTELDRKYRERYRQMGIIPEQP